MELKIAENRSNKVLLIKSLYTEARLRQVRLFSSFFHFSYLNASGLALEDTFTAIGTFFRINNRQIILKACLLYTSQLKILFLPVTQFLHKQIGHMTW